MDSMSGEKERMNAACKTKVELKELELEMTGETNYKRENWNKE